MPERITDPYAPQVRSRSRMVGATGAFLVATSLLSLPGYGWWPLAVVGVLAVGIAVLAVLTSRLEIEVGDSAVRWIERSVVPGFGRVQAIERTSVDQLFVWQRDLSIVRERSLVPPLLRLIFLTYDPELREVGRRRVYQLCSRSRGQDRILVDHPRPDLLRAVEQAAERRWGLIDSKVSGEAPRVIGSGP